ncbi:multicopper partial [Plasmopara halstedii]|uniref:Multicopper partial n=1 Tax=Plasmopara halstedii TaxID=4781 RepID=A0A0P1B6Z2_PLAHL|nr:multicopper partial [Plasmopara halstedii]CEG49870.1 multicopper partial [Plasmopara halstedii]
MQNGLGYIALDGGDFHHFVHPVDPPLFSIADGLKTEQLPVDANALKIDFGKHAELVLVNVKGEQHPFHLHSHSVYIVASGTAPLEQIFNNTLPPPNLVDPMTRDVYTVEPCKLDGNGTCQEAGYVVLRFNADSPGVWVLHCHIDWHIEAGLSMMYVEGEEELQQRGAKSFSNAVLSVCGRNSRFSPT